ncbi:Protein of unknown function [Lactobacillus helveticus CIRM-BIA 101]|nr:Protein of unknown function [Lactobacillus helveticus CIRM-BIA 101]
MGKSGTSKLQIKFEYKGNPILAQGKMGFEDTSVLDAYHHFTKKTRIKMIRVLRSYQTYCVLT